MTGSRALRTALVLLTALWIPLSALGKFESRRSPFEFSIRNVAYPFEIGSVFKLPGEKVNVKISKVPGDFEFDIREGLVKRLAPTEWEWQSPLEVGIHKVEISNPSYDEDVDLHVFVMEPQGRVVNGNLNGYRIGSYPARPLNDNPIYLPPKGFIPVTKDNADTQVSPHFKLKQFICKQQANYPHYVVLNEELLLKLELILERLNLLGYNADTLHVMSGYRTPYYNKAIGNVDYSLHQWGRAADIFVDDNNDGMMDDLNKDGKTDVKDATLLRDLVQKLFAERSNAHLAGGLGLYDATAAHGPFVHVDARGYSAKW